MIKTRVYPLLLLVLSVACCGVDVSAATTLSPARHAGFDHYTLALTWQPGFCSTDGGCRPDQPTAVFIGLHGLWASRPSSLIESGISAPQWWRRGCDYFQHSDSAPDLPAAILHSLHHVMPHLRHSLLKHEYDKHVQCFGFNTDHFFITALRMRRSIADSEFGHYLTRQARGRRVTRRHVIKAFMRTFHTKRRRALQLRCGTGHHGRTVLTQMWITLRASAVSDFPGRGSLMNAPIRQNNCPAKFRVPAWPSGSEK